MGTTGLGEGHEKTGTGATWQSDGLRDTDVLSTATLTNFVERGLYNGVVPMTQGVQIGITPSVEIVLFARIQAGRAIPSLWILA